MASRYVTVPQQDGELTVQVGNGEPRTWRVDAGVVTARTIEEEATLLVHVDGARRATAKRVAAVKGADAEQAPAADTTPPTTQADPSVSPAQSRVAAATSSPAPVGVQSTAPAAGDNA